MEKIGSECAKKLGNLEGRFAIRDNIIYLIEAADEDNPGFVWCSDHDGETYRLWLDSFDHIYDEKEEK